MTVSEAQKRATKKWRKENYDEIKIRIPKGEREKIKEFAAEKGESLNGFIKKAIELRMKNE